MLFLKSCREGSALATHERWPFAFLTATEPLFEDRLDALIRRIQRDLAIIDPVEQIRSGHLVCMSREAAMAALERIEVAIVRMHETAARTRLTRVGGVDLLMAGTSGQRLERGALLQSAPNPCGKASVPLPTFPVTEHRAQVLRHQDVGVLGDLIQRGIDLVLNRLLLAITLRIQLLAPKIAPADVAGFLVLALRMILFSERPELSALAPLCTCPARMTARASRAVTRPVDA